MNFQTDERFLVTILLIGSPELAAKVRRLKHLDQRIAIRYHLNTLDDTHTARYIAHRLTMAGPDRPDLHGRSDQADLRLHARDAARDQQPLRHRPAGRVRQGACGEIDETDRRRGHQGHGGGVLMVRMSDLVRGDGRPAPAPRWTDRRRRGAAGAVRGRDGPNAAKSHRWRRPSARARRGRASAARSRRASARREIRRGSRHRGTRACRCAETAGACSPARSASCDRGHRRRSVGAPRALVESVVGSLEPVARSLLAREHARGGPRASITWPCTRRRVAVHGPAHRRQRRTTTAAACRARHGGGAHRRRPVADAGRRSCAGSTRSRRRRAGGTIARIRACPRSCIRRWGAARSRSIGRGRARSTTSASRARASRRACTGAADPDRGQDPRPRRHVHGRSPCRRPQRPRLRPHEASARDRPVARTRRFRRCSSRRCSTRSRSFRPGRPWSDSTPARSAGGRGQPQPSAAAARGGRRRLAGSALRTPKSVDLSEAPFLYITGPVTETVR